MGTLVQREGLEGQAIAIKYFFLLHLLQPTLAPQAQGTLMKIITLHFLVIV
jgi:hypothetical protein